MGSRVESGGISVVPGLERKVGLRPMGFGMGLGEGSQAPCTRILNSFNGDCRLIPCQVVGMRRTGSGAGGQDQGIHPESPQESSCRKGARERSGWRKPHQQLSGPQGEGSWQGREKREKGEKRGNITC